MTPLPASIYFLSVDEVKDIHTNQISLYGGTHAVRDEGLLSSAVAQPSSGFGDQYLHGSLTAMAAAYLFHLVMNHPFVDGNKRTGLTSALVFLDLNGWELDLQLDGLGPDNKTKLEAIVIDVTIKSISKEKLVEFFELNAKQIVAP